jgi:ligand-binding sensor domain-containing protein
MKTAKGTVVGRHRLSLGLDNSGGLNRFNRQENNFTRYLHDPANPHSLMDNKVRAIFEDDHGNFWIGTRGNGIHLLDRKSGRIDRIPINTEGSKGLIRPPVTSPFDNINFITQDATGFLWFGTENAGLIRYDPLTQTSLQYRSNSNTTSGFTDTSGWWCYVSPDGPMWVSTGEASVFQVDLFTNTIPEHISDTLVINDITEETDSILWMATQNGLLREDLQNGSFQQFRHDSQNPETISDNVVVAVAKDSDGMMWLGTQNGLNMIDPRTHKIKRILHDPNNKRILHDPNNKERLSNNNIKGIFEDKDRMLWIATYGGGLNRLDKRTEKFTSYVNNPTDTTSISENLVAGILQDDDGSIWVRTNTSGLNRLDVATGKFRRYLQGKSGKHFFKDSKGGIWVKYRLRYLLL